MCNVLLISTEQWIDLALFNCEDISFTQHLPDYVPEIIEMKFEHRWYIAGYPNVQSCSCQFRIRPLELGFNPPEDWFCEDEQAIKATKIAYEIFKYLMGNQIQFEIIESTPEEIAEANKPKIPIQVKNMKFRLALIKSGIMPSSIDTAINQMPEGTMKENIFTLWNFADYLERNDASLNYMAGQFNITHEQLDNLFILANTL